MMFDLPEQKYQAKKFSVFGIVGEGWLVIGYAALLIFVACGCSSTASVSPEIKEQASGLTAFAKVEAKQDKTIESIEATRSEIVSQNRQIIDTLKTLEASLIKSEPQPLGGDPAALEPPPAKNAKDSQHTSRIVAEPVGARLTSDGTRLRWNVEGNWNPTILETSAHLAEHGIDTNGMTHQQMADIHADIHEGKTSGGAPLTGSIFQNNRAGAITSQRTTFRSVPQRVSFFGRTKYSNRQSCPSGRCPQR